MNGATTIQERLKDLRLNKGLKLEELAEKGNQYEREKQYDQAMQVWMEGLSLIPEPQQFYSETVWFSASIGDVYFRKGMYQQAYEYFDKARGNLSGAGYQKSFYYVASGRMLL